MMTNNPHHLSFGDEDHIVPEEEFHKAYNAVAICYLGQLSFFLLHIIQVVVNFLASHWLGLLSNYVSERILRRTNELEE